VVILFLPKIAFIPFSYCMIYTLHFLEGYISCCAIGHVISWFMEKRREQKPGQKMEKEKGVRAWLKERKGKEGEGGKENVSILTECLPLQ
jgi:hypothetical protein